MPLGQGRRLVLENGGGALLTAFVGILALALLLVLYRFERSVVSRQMGVALFALRIAAALTLILALFNPIIVHSYRDTIRGRVVLGVDFSMSMETTDPTRTGDEEKRL